MTKRSQVSDSVKIRLVAPAAAAAATSLLSPIAWSAPGDLDPSFGDVGRVIYQTLSGPVQAVVADGSDVLFGGGVDDTSYYTFDGFIDRLEADGAKDGLFQRLDLAASDIHDVARQQDGKVVGVGLAQDAVGRPGLLVIRLNADGTPDTGFGDGGTVLLVDSPASYTTGRAVIVEPDGRITVAGSRGGRPIVLRLTESGAFDLTFADAGIYTGETDFHAWAIVRTPGGGYRIALYNWDYGWRLLGLTSAGAVDESFGQQGWVQAVSALPGYSDVAGLAVDDAGRLLVAGTQQSRDAARGFATVLDAKGEIDATFDADAATAGFASISAMAAGGGSIYLAGADASRAPGHAIVRLDSMGALDTGFGDQGRTWFDSPSMRSDSYGSPAVKSLDVLPDGTLIAGGGTLVQPVVARYLGNAGGDSPGIVGVANQSPEPAAEAAGVARLLVRRVGGSAGAVSVAYSAEQTEAIVPAAQAGTDFTAVAGRLEWADGDTEPKEVLVPLVQDAAGESTEFFNLRLSDPQGGAGLGTELAVASIPGDGYPAGLIGLAGDAAAREGARVSLAVHRNLFFAGPVSVTVNVTAGSATEGVDYVTPVPITLTWADGEAEPKTVTFDTLQDSIAEGGETFSVSLSNPTGGATLATASSLNVVILDDDTPIGGGGGSGGGGSAGWLVTWLFGLLGFARRRIAR